MTDLAGKSVIVLKVTPEHMNKALGEIGSVVGVHCLDRVIGSCNIVLTRDFLDEKSLSSFAEKLKTQPYCEECYVYPNHRNWEREESQPMDLGCWALIDTGNIEEVFDELKKIPEVKWVVSTSGKYNLIAKIEAVEGGKLSEVLQSKVPQLPGIKRTETLIKPSTKIYRTPLFQETENGPPRRGRGAEEPC